LISLTTEADRTLFFDFLPVDIGKVKEFNIRFQLYTVPGQVRYNATRRLVLRGADAVVFVADSQKEMKAQNIESFNNMRENLTVNNIDPDDIPVLLQYNKRDVPNVMDIAELNKDLNKHNAPFFEAVATEGKGVKEMFDKATEVLIRHIAKKHKVDIEAPVEVVAPGAAPAAPAPEAAAPQSRSVQSMKPDVAPVAPQIEPTSHTEAPPVLPMPQKTIVQQAPVSIDISELVSSIGDLRDVLSEISGTFKEMQKKQIKMSNDLAELKQIFSEARKSKGLRRLFG
ncbi:MAG TPA: hypothetical protein ENG93_01165, partial [Nitrospirae bacterium]|nr:hypothetical protein [Nitrospirota bacterium]